MSELQLPVYSLYALCRANPNVHLTDEILETTRDGIQMKKSRLVFFILLMQTLVSVNCDLLQGGPSDEQIKLAIDDVLTKNVPKRWISKNYIILRGEFGDFRVYLDNAIDGKLDEVRVIQRGKKQNLQGIEFWPIKLYLRGTCTAVYTTVMKERYTEKNNFELKTEGNFHKDPYGKWVVTAMSWW